MSPGAIKEMCLEVRAQSPRPLPASCRPPLGPAARDRPRRSARPLRAGTRGRAGGRSAASERASERGVSVSSGSAVPGEDWAGRESGSAAPPPGSAPRSRSSSAPAARAAPAPAAPAPAPAAAASRCRIPRCPSGPPCCSSCWRRTPRRVSTAGGFVPSAHAAEHPPPPCVCAGAGCAAGRAGVRGMRGCREGGGGVRGVGEGPRWGRGDPRAAPRARRALGALRGAVWCAGQGSGGSGAIRRAQLFTAACPCSCSSPAPRPAPGLPAAPARLPSRAAARPGSRPVPAAEAAASVPDLRGDQARTPGEGVRGGALQQGGGPGGVWEWPRDGKDTEILWGVVRLCAPAHPLPAAGCRYRRGWERHREEEDPGPCGEWLEGTLCSACARAVPGLSGLQRVCERALSEQPRLAPAGRTATGGWKGPVHLWSKSMKQDQCSIMTQLLCLDTLLFSPASHPSCI